LNLELKTLEKRNRKGIRNSREIGKAISAQSSPPGPAPRAPAAPDRRTSPVGASLLVRSLLSLPLSLAAQWTQIVGATGPRVPLPSMPRGPRYSRRAVTPAHPFLSPCAVGQPCQFRLPRARRGPAHAHSRTSSDFSAMTLSHAPNSLHIAPLVPRAHPSPHFARLYPLSRSALAASRRRRPAPAFPAIQLAGVCAKPPRAPP
jgi:hypothetical protein